MKTLATAIALSLLFVTQAAQAQGVAPYVHIFEEGGFVEFDLETMEPTGMVWGYDLAVVTGIVNWNYVGADYGDGYVFDLDKNGFDEEAAVADQFEWRLPTVAELQDAVDKGLFADPDLMWGIRPDIPRWTSEKKGKRAYAVKLDNGEALLKHVDSFGVPIVVRAMPGDNGGPGNGKGKNK